MKTKNTPRELTVDEAREKFLITLWNAVEYWDKSDGCVTLNDDGTQGYKKHTSRDKLEGLLHTILASGLDGCSIGTPSMKIVPIVSNEDIKFYKTNKDSWFPKQWYPQEDIGGSLHEIMYPVGRKHGFVKD